MAERWPDLLRASAWAELPSRVYRALVGELLGTPALVNVAEATLVGLIGGVAAWRSDDPWLAMLTLATAAVILLVIPLRRYGRLRYILDEDIARLNAFERRFERLSWAVSFGIGAMAARGIVASGDAVVHLMLVSLALGAMSGTIRYHFRPRIAFGRTVTIAAPLTLAFIAAADPLYLVLATGAAAAALLFLDICRQLHGGAVALLMMVQEKETLAAELEGANADLERRQAERRESEAVLRRLRSELTHVSRLSAMGAMASTLAHELNQPLTAIANYVRGGRRRLATPGPEALAEVGEALEAAEAGALRAGQIIRRLRGLVYRGSAETRPENVEALVREACDLALADARRLGVAHRLELAPEARWASVDHIQIQQVLINIVRNAVEAMHDSPVKEVAIATRALPEGLVEISVADTGPGISNGQDGALFTPFRSTKSEGLGIGLSISRTIVEAHGGKIWAANRDEGGAVFRFTLPLSEAPGQDQPRRLAAS